MRPVKMTYVKVYVRGTQRGKKIGKGLDADIFFFFFAFSYRFSRLKGYLFELILFDLFGCAS